MADETILEQDVLTAATIANPAEWFFGVERLGFATPHQISLSEIGVALVDPVDADITALDARLDAAEAQLLTLVTLPGNITTLQADLALLDGRVGVNEANIILLETRIVALETLVYNVQDYGALGDGVTDDTAAVAAAVAAIPATGGTLYFPEGEYVGEVQITGRDGLTIRGAGRLATKLLGGGPGTNCLDLVNCNHLEVRDLWFFASGDSSAADDQKDDGLLIEASQDIIVRDCRATNHGFAGICFFDCSNVLCTGNYCADAVGFSSTNSVDIIATGNVALQNYRIIGNQCLSTNNSGIGIQPLVPNLDHKNFLIEGNVCVGHGRYGIIAYMTLSDEFDDTIKGVSVVGNSCEDNKWSGIYYQSVEDSTIVGNTTRANNIFQAATGLEGGIHVNGSVGITVSGNTCYDEIGGGIRVNGHLLYASRRSGVTISGNVVRNQTTAGHACYYVGPNISGCVIDGNIVQGSASQGLYVHGTVGILKELVITNNEFDGLGSASRGMHLDGPNVSAIITGNRITGWFFGLLIAEGDAFNVKDNHISGNTTDIQFTGTLEHLIFADNQYDTGVGVPIGIVNVKHYGATGDGVTDDTLAIDAAVAALPSTGGELYFPRGTYVGEIEFSTKDNVTIRGDGKSTVLLSNGPGSNCIKVFTSSHLTITGLTLTASGDSAAASIQVDNGIYIHGCDGVLISDCHITNHGFAGIASYNCTNVSVLDNYIEAAAGFTSTNASDIYFSGNVALSNYSIRGNRCLSANYAGITVQPDTGNLDHKNVLILGNTCSGHLRYGIIAYMSLAADTDDTLKNVRTIGNVCESNGWCGIYYQSLEDSTIVGNETRATNILGVGSGVEGGITVNASTGITVTGNNCHDEVGSGIRVHGHVTFASRQRAVTLSANTIRNQTTAGHPSIYVGANMAACVITSNIVRGSASQGIYIAGTAGATKDLLISNNDLDGNGSASRGIDLDGPNVSAVVTANRCTGWALGLRISEGNHLNVRDNHVLGNTTDIQLLGTLDDFCFADNVFGNAINGTPTVTVPTFGSGDTTPSVRGVRYAKTANAAPTNLGALDDGFDSQIVTILFDDANTTVDFSATTLKGNAGVDWTPALGDHMVCTRIAGNWYCQISDNTA